MLKPNEDAFVVPSIIRFRIILLFGLVSRPSLPMVRVRLFRYLAFSTSLYQSSLITCRVGVL
jgi:hypothetical protein